MKVIVLGSGIIGVATAWFASQQGHEVVVIDRQPGPAQETSFANGCQISVSYAEPWASPGALLKLIKWLGKEDAPLLFRPRPELAQWLWGLRFLRECTPGRVRHNIQNLVGMCAYSRDVLQSLRREIGIDYDHLERGIVNFYTSHEEAEGADQNAAVMRELGCNRHVISKEDVLRIEPALQPIADRIVAGDYTAEDETGDIYKFTLALTERCKARGVQFHFNHQITRLLRGGDRIEGVELIGSDGKYRVERADAYVTALGSFTPFALETAGLSAPIYPTKGYSATFRITDASKAPWVSVADSNFKMVFTRIGDRLRIAGTAELNGWNRELNPARCEALRRRTRELFPEACDYDTPLYWTGLRPSTPSNIPLIGRTRVSNLYINAGHGTLGWTMGCGSGKAMADILSGRAPEVDFAFTGDVPRPAPGMGRRAAVSA
ncbi:D-amino acid dehydrogenase [Piscinibacterium candidicorallinum]|uniref:D-amino acid dehydrogenase n=1 Tax=Piscinibacterium candidicorallinum TaxID=1793872 RepID=A0ABV7H0I3_9BURK